MRLLSGSCIFKIRFSDIVMKFPNGASLSTNSPSDGIALSGDAKTLFYCSISRKELWALDAVKMGDTFTPISEVIASIQKVMTKKGFADGMAHTNDSRLIFGDLEEGSVLKSTDGGKPILIGQTNVTWVDTFGFDGIGGIYVTTNNLERFITRTMDPNDNMNFALYRLSDASKPYFSYMNHD